MSIMSAISDFCYAASAGPVGREGRRILSNLYNAEYGTSQFSKAWDDLAAFAPQYGLMDLRQISTRTRMIQNNFALPMEQRGDGWKLFKRMETLEKRHAFFRECADATAGQKGLFHQVVHDLACIDVCEMNMRNSASRRVNAAAIKAVHLAQAIENGAMENYTFGDQTRAKIKRNHDRLSFYERVGHPRADDWGASFE